MSSVNLSTHESYGISWDFCLCSLPRKQAVWLSKQNQVNLAKTYGFFFTWSWTSGSVNIQIRKLNPSRNLLLSCFLIFSSVNCALLNLLTGTLVRRWLIYLFHIAIIVVRYNSISWVELLLWLEGKTPRVFKGQN